jgi:hypothetical protein
MVRLSIFSSCVVQSVVLLQICYSLRDQQMLEAMQATIAHANENDNIEYYIYIYIYIYDFSVTRDSDHFEKHTF